jgi:hypothetical protein
MKIYGGKPARETLSGRSRWFFSNTIYGISGIIIS